MLLTTKEKEKYKESVGLVRLSFSLSLSLSLCSCHVQGRSINAIGIKFLLSFFVLPSAPLKIKYSDLDRSKTQQGEQKKTKLGERKKTLI